MCLQPKCDAVRLDDPREFVLAQLSLASEDNQKFDLVVPTANGTSKKYQLNHKIPVLRTVRFVPDGIKKMVMGKLENGLWVFTAEGESKWHWLAEVRELQALSLVSKILSQLGRTGINQSEWLRLHSSK